MGFAWVMALPIWILNGAANGILRLARIKRSGEHDRLHSPEEIRLLVEQSQEAGSLQEAGRAPARGRVRVHREDS